MLSVLQGQTKNDVHDTLDLPEASCTEPEGDLHQSVLWPLDLKGEAGGSEFDKPQPEVAGVTFALVGLNIADAAVFILELPLKQNVGLDWRIGMVVGGQVLVAERGLETLVVEIADGDVSGV